MANVTISPCASVLDVSSVKPCRSQKTCTSSNGISIWTRLSTTLSSLTVHYDDGVRGGKPKYKSPLKRGRKTGNVLSKVLYHLDNTCQEKSRCRDGTPQLVLPSMIPPAPP